MSHKRGKDSQVDEDVISLTPTAGFDIRKEARRIHGLMHDLQKSLIIHLPLIEAEFELGCTVKQLIEGYQQALREQMAEQKRLALSNTP